jgi:16S rRNA (adenine1518-N6/adenine1519-N6)-dimethyltransferase
LYELWGGFQTKSEVEELLESLGLTGLVRAEALNVQEFIALAKALKDQAEKEKTGEHSREAGDLLNDPEPD